MLRKYLLFLLFISISLILYLTLRTNEVFADVYDCTTTGCPIGFFCNTSGICESNTASPVGTVCGNGICEWGEGYISCPADCTLVPGVTQDCGPASSCVGGVTLCSPGCDITPRACWDDCPPGTGPPTYTCTSVASCTASGFTINCGSNANACGVAACGPTGCYSDCSNCSTPGPSCTPLQPAVPSNPLPAHGSITGINTTLQWILSTWGNDCITPTNSNSTANNIFHIKLGTDTNNMGTKCYFPNLADSVTTSDGTCIAGNLTPGQRYYWRVEANNGVLTSSSQNWYFNVCSNFQGPLAPNLVSPLNNSTDVHSNMATLDWNETMDWGASCCADGTVCNSTSWPACCPARSYKVYMDTGSALTKVCTTGSGVTSCQAPITALNTSHNWKVCANNSFGEACSLPWSFTPSHLKPNSATSGSPQGNLTTNSLSFMWNHDGIWGTNVNTSNLVLNNGFENGTTDWSLEGGGTKEIVYSSFEGNKAIHVKDGGVCGSQRARVIQWPDLENNTSYTMTLAIKGSSGTVSADEWCLGGGAGNSFKNGNLFTLAPDWSQQSWGFTSATCDADQTHKLAIYFDTCDGRELWGDSVTLFKNNINSQYFYVDYSTASGSYNWTSPKCSLTGSVPGAYDSCGPFAPDSPTPINWGTTYFWKVRASNNGSNFTDPNTYNDSLEWSFTPNHGPWFQVFGGDVYAGGIISSEIPKSTCTAPACQPYLLPTLATQKHGVVVYNNTFSLGNDCTGACIPGNISEDSDDWYVQTNLDTTNYSYSWLGWVGHLANETKINLNSSNLGTIGADGVYTLDASISELYGTVAANRKIIILANKANLSVSNNISVPAGSFLMVIGSGNLNINSALGGTAVAPALQGIFIADQIHFGVSSVHLFSAGTFVGVNGITLGRDLVGGNNTAPAVTFIYRPDFVINAPSSVKKIYLPRWEQVPG